MYRLPVGEEKHYSHINILVSQVPCPKRECLSGIWFRLISCAPTDNPRRQECADCNKDHPTTSNDKTSPLHSTEMALPESWAVGAFHVTSKNSLVWRFREEGIAFKNKQLVLSSFKQELSFFKKTKPLWQGIFCREDALKCEKSLLFLSERHEVHPSDNIPRHSTVPVSLSLFVKKGPHLAPSGRFSLQGNFSYVCKMSWFYSKIHVFYPI